MEQILEHSGVVERVVNDTVFVKITAESACGTCRAREACGMSEAQDKMIGVQTRDSGCYAPGDTVTVGVNRRAGGIAVFWGYVMALIVLLVLLVVGIKVLGWSEGTTVLLSISGVAAYYAVLWLCRRKIETNIHFTITKL